MEAVGHDSTLYTPVTSRKRLQRVSAQEFGQVPEYPVLEGGLVRATVEHARKVLWFSISYSDPERAAQTKS